VSVPAPRDDLGQLIVASSAEVDALPWQPLGNTPGVSHKVLWRSGDVVLGLIRLEPGAENPAHVHQGAHHHILVTHGSATMIGRPLDAGSYVYVPPGVAHEVVDVGPEGCTFFYTYRPVEVPPRGAPSPLDDDWGATGSLA
jgi:quercetin dioxygenase-like cupin family protein